MSSRAQQKKKPAGAPSKAAGQKSAAERQIETQRRLAEYRRSLEEHARKLDESISQASDAATEHLAERLKPLKDKLRSLIGPARAMDLALQRLEDARVGLDVPTDAPPLLDMLIEAEPHGSAYDPETKWAADADPEAVERAALDLFDDLHRQCETLDAAIKKAEGEAQAAFAKLVKPVREQQIPACLDTAKKLAQWMRNRTAASMGRPLPFTGTGTADELQAAAKKSLGAGLDLAEKVRAAIDGIDIQAPAASIADDVLSDDTDGVEQPAVA